MENQLIIAIGREYGSGGHDIAEKLAKELGLKLYDKEIIQEAAKRFKYGEDVLEYYDEKPVNSVLFQLDMETFMQEMSMEDSVEKGVALAEFAVIREKSEQESFVIVGRCAEHILKDKDIISVFIRADDDWKLKRIQEKYDLREDDAAAIIKRNNNVRRCYHNFYCDDTWGSAMGYDLCLNSATFGVDGCVDIIKACVEQKKK